MREMWTSNDQGPLEGNAGKNVLMLLKKNCAASVEVCGRILGCRRDENLAHVEIKCRKKRMLNELVSLPTYDDGR